MSTEYVYLIHFRTPYQHARHYIGKTSDLRRRMADHLQGRSNAALMTAVWQAGIQWDVVAVWRGSKAVEKQLQAWHGGHQLCPKCGGKYDPLPDKRILNFQSLLF